MPEIRTTSSTGGQKGVKLERHDLIPAGPLKELAEHFGKGAMKYDAHQWRQGYEWSKSYSAMARHQMEWLAGRDYDTCMNEPDNCVIRTVEGNIVSFDYREAVTYSNDHGMLHIKINGENFLPSHDVDLGRTCYNHTGSHHMVAVAWHAFVLLELRDTHPEHDDRYKPTPADSGLRMDEEGHILWPSDENLTEFDVEAWNNANPGLPLTRVSPTHSCSCHLYRERCTVCKAIDCNVKSALSKE